MTWIASSLQPVLQRCWGDQCIVYDIDSGNTHLVTPLACKVLSRLADCPSSTENLTLHVSAGQSEDTLLVIHETLAIVLDELEAIGLVHRGVT